MAKSKICLSFILLFFFLLSSSVFSYELPQTSLENHHFDEGKVFKEPNPTTSSYDLERMRRGGSSHFVRHGYKTPSFEETSKGTLSKDIAEVDKLGLENRKWNFNIGFGDGNSRGSNGIGGGSSRSNGGMGGSNGAMGGSNGQGDFYNGGGGRSMGGGGGGSGGGGYAWGNNIWDCDYTYDYYDCYFPDPFNYKDASVMRHQNMKKLSEFDRRSFHESKAKTFGMRNGDKIHYGGVPRMEDIGQEKRN